MSESALRRARYLVLEALYESENSNHDAEDAYNRRVEAMEEEDPEVAEPGPSGFGRGTLRGVLKRREELDSYISSAAAKHPLEMMPVVDRNILRLAIWELLSDTSAPVAAVVNEAVELAHRYGSERSPAFINGVLRTVSARIKSASAGERAATGPDDSYPEQQEN